MTSKIALITGVNGQDGAYLSRLLLEKGYEVYGAHRQTATTDVSRLSELGILGDVRLLPFDLLDGGNILRTIERIRPQEVYNLAAQSYVALSFEQPVYTGDADGLGVTRLLEAIRAVSPTTRFYQASSSEMFGKVRETPQTEETPFHPRSPYGVAKMYGHWITRNYRESYGMHAGSGILFNHESPLRGLQFVTRKITATFALIRQGKMEALELGNLDVKRDWGFAGDYVSGMWKMLQVDEADDFVLATGRNHSVREFVSVAASVAGFDLEWSDHEAFDRATGHKIVRTNPSYFRPAEVDVVLGDATKAREKLGWVPEVGFEALVTMMVESDLDKASKGFLNL